MSLLELCHDASLHQFFVIPHTSSQGNFLDIVKSDGTAHSLALRKLQRLLPPRSSREPGDDEAPKVA